MWGIGLQKKKALYISKLVDINQVYNYISYMSNTNDYIYKNSEDTFRVSVFKHTDGGWDAHTFTKDGGMEHFASEFGTTFRTRKEAKANFEASEGKLQAFNPGDRVTNGWK